MAEVSYGSLPFAEQIAFFRRKVNLPTNAWTDIWQQAHDYAFVVAGANRIDLVKDFRTAIDKAISQGTTLAEFRKDFDSIVAKHGWSYNGGRNWRSRVIYETNLRTSYAAGRYAQLQAVKKSRPYWQYVHNDSVEHPRPLHKKWGDTQLTLHADDPWWQTHYPPNGWGCQCAVKSLAPRDLKRTGKELDTAPPDDMQTVTVGARGPTQRTVQTPAGIDPGFGYAPGRDAWERQWVNRAADVRAAQDAQRWEQVLTTTAADLGLPAQLPVAPLPAGVHLATPAATDIAGLIDTLREVLGADMRVFDVKGLPVIVDAEFLGQHLALGRSIFLPLIPDVLENPQEIWLQLERQTESGAMRASAVVVKTYDMGRNRSLRFVARVQEDGTLLSWTLVPLRGARGANNSRRGMLWWGGAAE